MRNAMIIDKSDNVVVAIEEIKKGDMITYVCEGEELSFPALEDVTIFHKAACRDIAKDADVCKYGEVIGSATCDIRQGEHVHVHNVTSHSHLQG